MILKREIVKAIFTGLLNSTISDKSNIYMYVPKNVLYSILLLLFPNVILLL
jgi:hypothetical protein